MGQYWKPVNLDKGEQVHPHRLNDGLKLGEWYEWDDEPIASATRARLNELVAGRWSGDEVRILGDEGGEIHFSGPTTDREAAFGDDWGDVSR